MKTLIGFCAVILMGSCVKPLKLSGRACDCVTGYVCCNTTGTCMAPSDLCPAAPADAGATPETAASAADTGDDRPEVSDAPTDSPVELPPIPTGPWTAIPVDPQLPGRSGHTALWTGEEMIIWGGHNNLRVLNNGARYNPKTGVWRAISDVGAAGITGHTAVWTGAEMIVWGGTQDLEGRSYSASGATYDPRADRWTALPAEAPIGARAGHAAVWTGTEMLIWGGERDMGLVIDGTGGWTGARYHPTGGWSALSTDGEPPATYGHTVIWTGQHMVVWGGNSPARHRSVVTGGIYDPARDQWTATSFDGNPGPRYGHTSVWTGQLMLVWGGFNDNPAQPPAAWSQGGRFDPIANTWSPMAFVGAGGQRLAHAAVWVPGASGKMLIWGGIDQPATAASGTLSSGAAYDLTLNEWTPLTVAGAPDSRYRHTAIWTGAEMIVWGGLGLDRSDIFARADGARYQP